MQIRDLEKQFKELEENVGRIEGDKDELVKTLKRTTDKLMNVRKWRKNGRLNTQNKNRRQERSWKKRSELWSIR